MGGVSASSGLAPASSILYNAFGMTKITYGSGNSNAYAYDSNTGRMTSYQFNVVNNQSASGALTWNKNGTLQQLVVNDVYQPDTQTCVNTYDDLMRLAQNSCGALWGQSFSYDPFGNLEKAGLAGSAGTSFQATYNQATNRFATLPASAPAYDGNGNVTNDGIHSYVWDAEGGAIELPQAQFNTYDAPGPFCGARVERLLGRRCRLARLRAIASKLDPRARKQDAEFHR